MSCKLYDTSGVVWETIPCNTTPGSPNLFTGVVQYTNYGYLLTPWATYTFLSLFTICAVAHIALGIYRRTWWLLGTMAAGTIVEVIGWGGRLWSLQSTTWSDDSGGVWELDFNGFIMQTVCLVIAPTFFSAANYVLLGRLIDRTSNEYSSLHPRSLRILFITADFCCLVIQGAGGGLAGTAADTGGANRGAYIMTGGVILQLVVTVIYCVLFAEWLIRRHNDRPVKKQYRPFVRRRHEKSIAFTELGDAGSDGAHASTGPSTPGTESRSNMSSARINAMVCLIVFTTLLIVIRSVYRSVELTDGWAGPIAVNERLFLCLDALLMLILVITYAVLHPGLYIG